MDMAIQRDDRDEREARMDIIIERIPGSREARVCSSAASRCGRARSSSLGIVPFDATLPPNKIN